MSEYYYKNLFNTLSYDVLSSIYFVVMNEHNKIPTIINELKKIYEDPGYRQKFIEEYQKRYLDEFLR